MSAARCIPAPYIHVGLEVVQCSIDLLEERHAVELVQHRLVKPFPDPRLLEDAASSVLFRCRQWTFSSVRCCAPKVCSLVSIEEQVDVGSAMLYGNTAFHS